MTVTGETVKNSLEQLEGSTRASVEYLSDVKWKDDDPLFVFDDDNVTKPQTLTVALIPVRACDEENPVAPPFESPLRKKPHFQESIADRLLKTAPGHLKLD